MVCVEEEEGQSAELLQNVCPPCGSLPWDVFVMAGWGAVGGRGGSLIKTGAASWKCWQRILTNFPGGAVQHFVLQPRSQSVHLVLVIVGSYSNPAEDGVAGATLRVSVQSLLDWPGKLTEWFEQFVMAGTPESSRAAKWTCDASMQI